MNKLHHKTTPVFLLKSLEFREGEAAEERDNKQKGCGVSLGWRGGHSRDREEGERRKRLFISEEKLWEK